MLFFILFLPFFVSSSIFFQSNLNPNFQSRWRLSLGVIVFVKKVAYLMPLGDNVLNHSYHIPTLHFHCYASSGSFLNYSIYHRIGQ